MTFRRFLLLSLALHLALLAAFFFRGRRAQEALEPAAVMVDLPVAEAPVVSGPGHFAAHAPVPIPFSALAPVHKNTLIARPLGTPAPSETDALSPYSGSVDLFKAASKEDTGALTWVYRKAQLTIGYPAAFVKHDITGEAQARLVFDSSGKLKPELLHVTSDSPYLRVYVYRTLESTFGRESVPANLVRWKDTLEVFCFVKFSFSESQTAVAITGPILGNRLFFNRRSVKSSAEKLQWNLGPLHGLFPVPVVGVDMLWFARKYGEMKHPLRSQVEADDLGPYRKDPLFSEI
ncbi:MAG: hypothetical protein ACXWR1_06005 [Bdellovibrionota bacterium]